VCGLLFWFSFVIYGIDVYIEVIECMFDVIWFVVVEIVCCDYFELLCELDILVVVFCCVGWMF